MRQFPVESLSCPRPPHPFKTIPQWCSAELNEWTCRRDEASVAENTAYELFSKLLMYLIGALVIYIAVRLVMHVVTVWRYFHSWFGAVGYVPAEYELVDKEEAERRTRQAMGMRNVRCVICPTGARFPVIIDCGHCYCFTCLSDHIRNNRTDFYVSTCFSCDKIFRVITPLRWPQNRYHRGMAKIYENELNEYNERFDPNLSFFERRRKYGRTFFNELMAAATSESFSGPSEEY